VAAPIRTQRIGWYFYDWANSAFYATVVTVFLGPYLTNVAEAAAIDGKLHLLGFALNPGSWFPLMVSLAVVLQVLILPVVGALTDASHRKRRLLGTFAFTGAIATTALYFLQVDLGNYLLGGGLFVLANLCFGASVVVYNSFLPDLASPEERDKVSSRGWALGYLGGGLLLLLNLLYFSHVKSTDGPVGLAVRIILASAGIWWALFTIVPMMMLRDRPMTGITTGRLNARAAFRQLWSTLRHMTGYRQTLLFLIAYLLYNDAVQTVIALASQYGQEELGLGLDTLTTAILMVQFVAIGGSLLFERIAHVTSTKRAIMISLVIWSAVLFAAYTVVSTEAHFYIMAAVIAVVLGGTQALSRSMFSQMIPRGREAEYFSLYEISDKGTSWIGPLVFALALNVTGSYRAAVLSLVVFFIAGMIVLAKVDVGRAIEEAAD